MRVKIFMGMALLMAAVLTLTSCGKDESFASKQRAERKAVEKFIKERGIEVLHRYPANGVFGKNQYYLIDDGLNEGKVYLHVIDSGNGNRAVMGRTDVLMRCSGEDFFNRDTAIPFNLFVNEEAPIEFIYGTAQYVSSRGFYVHRVWILPQPRRGVGSALRGRERHRQPDRLLCRWQLATAGAIQADLL